MCPPHRPCRVSGAIAVLARWISGLALAGFGFSVLAAAPGARPEAAPDRCVAPAARYHHVDARVLRAILRVESSLRPGAINRNANGTIDVGIGQINSIHFQRLKKHGVTPELLQDACIGTYVAASILADVMAANGNTWEGVARYHSASPYCNARYQILLHNELVNAGALQGARMTVPAARPCGARPKR